MDVGSALVLETIGHDYVKMLFERQQKIATILLSANHQDGRKIRN